MNWAIIFISYGLQWQVFITFLFSLYLLSLINRSYLFLMCKIILIFLKIILKCAIVRLMEETFNAKSGRQENIYIYRQGKSCFWQPIKWVLRDKLYIGEQSIIISGWNQKWSGWEFLRWKGGVMNKFDFKRGFDKFVCAILQGITCVKRSPWSHANVLPSKGVVIILLFWLISPPHS